MLVERQKGRSVIMTEEHINEITPLVCRIIVRHDRDIEAECCKSVVSFDRFKELLAIRRGYTRDAARHFMPLSVKDGPLATV